MEPNDSIDHTQGSELHNNDIGAMSFSVEDILNTLTDTRYNPPSISSSSSASSSPTFTKLSQPNIPNLEGVRLKIVEQPAPKELRFRYICEGRSAGSLSGVNTTPENKTYPTIEIEGYEGKVKVVVSCVTKDAPYRPHPHNLVGKEGCENGICMATIDGPPMKVSFTNLGIQCVKKKDIKAALEERERKRIDPFKTRFAHKDQLSSIDATCVRLCFQAFIPIPGVKRPHPIPPVVSEPIFDKKSINELVICRLCSCAAKVTGGDTIILLCEKLPKEEVKVRFFEMRNDTLYWEDYGQFQQTDIHKQAAITFKTPRYKHPEIKHSVQVSIQLYRPTDDETSEPLPFEFYPDPGFNRKRSKIDEKFLREIQKESQILTSFSNNTNTDNYPTWNIPPAMPSPTSSTLATHEVKTESYLSPNYINGTYRNTYQTSPSPQPTSPMMIRNITTPSPGIMRNSSAESQTQMATIYNQSQINQNFTNNFSTNLNCTQPEFAAGFNEYNNNNNNMFNTKNAFNENIYNINEQLSSNNNINPNNNILNNNNQQHTHFQASTGLLNHTSGGSFTPIYANVTSNNNNINSQFQFGNMTNSIQQFQAIQSSNNVTMNPSQDSNLMLDLSRCLDDLIPVQNSEELRAIAPMMQVEIE